MLVAASFQFFMIVTIPKRQLLNPWDPNTNTRQVKVEITKCSIVKLQSKSKLFNSMEDQNEQTVNRILANNNSRSIYNSALLYKKLINIHTFSSVHTSTSQLTSSNIFTMQNLLSKLSIVKWCWNNQEIGQL